MSDLGNTPSAPRSMDAGPATPEHERLRSLAEEQMEALVEEGAPAEQLAPVVAELEPADAADKLEDLEPDASVEVIHEMENEAAAEALAHMETPLAATVIVDLPASEAAELIGLMDPDDAADLVQEVPAGFASEILSRMAPQRAAILGKLALYDPETAGGMMTTDLLVVGNSLTIGQAIDSIKAHPSDEEQLDVYVVDDEKRLVGTIGLRDLLVTSDNEHVSAHIDPEIAVLTPGMDREEVAHAFERYDHITMPVVDNDRRMLGMVTIDDVVDIIESELSEDPLVQVGAGAQEAAYSSAGVKIRSRLPWLVLNLYLAAAAASVVLLFEDFISAIPILAAMFPIIANQSGNAGHQSLAVALRGLALGQVRKELVTKLLQREIIAGVVFGIVIGGLFALSTALLGVFRPTITWRMGVVAGVALAGALPAACLVGTSIPLVLHRLGKDPAAASSIFLTMLTDAMAYGVFLVLAFVVEGWLIGTPATQGG